MNEEFEKWWDDNRLSFSGNSSNKPHHLDAYLAGAAAMKERCLEILCSNTDITAMRLIEEECKLENL